MVKSLLISLKKIHLEVSQTDGGTATMQNSRHDFKVASGAIHLVKGIELLP